MEADAPRLKLLVDGPSDASAAATTIVLAHGAGAGMDSPFMRSLAEGLAEGGVRVVRFEFPYMRKRRADGRRRPPDGPGALEATWREAIEKARSARLVIGGKSLGGRIASMIADDAGVAGLVCFGYPFHPPGRPEKTRTAHLKDLQTRALILQGTRDPFGGQKEVERYPLSSSIRLHWIEDGDHSFKPRARSGRTLEQNLTEAIETTMEFVARIPSEPI